MPELIRPKLKLHTVVVGDAGIRPVPENAFVAVDASDGLRHHRLAGRTWCFTRRDEIRKRRGKTGDFRIRVDGLVEPRAMIADVPRLEHGTGNDLALNSQSPFVRPLRFKVRWNTGFVEGAWVENAGSQVCGEQRTNVRPGRSRRQRSPPSGRDGKSIEQGHRSRRSD